MVNTKISSKYINIILIIYTVGFSLVHYLIATEVSYKTFRDGSEVFYALYNRANNLDDQGFPQNKKELKTIKLLNKDYLNEIFDDNISMSLENTNTSLDGNLESKLIEESNHSKIEESNHSKIEENKTLNEYFNVNNDFNNAFNPFENIAKLTGIPVMTYLEGSKNNKKISYGVLDSSKLLELYYFDFDRLDQTYVENKKSKGWVTKTLINILSKTESETALPFLMMIYGQQMLNWEIPMLHKLKELELSQDDQRITQLRSDNKKKKKRNNL